MWIFVDFFRNVTFGTLIVAMLIPIVLAVSGFVYAAKAKGMSRLLFLLLGIGMTAAILIAIVPPIMENMGDRKYENPENISVEISGKENAGSNVFHFPCVITNQLDIGLVGYRMDLVITNPEGKVLLEADIPSSPVAALEQDSFLLEVTVRGETAEELYCTDYAYLNVSVVMTYMQFENQGRYIDHTYPLQTADLTALENAYEEALDVFASGDHARALELFSTLGSYRDSAKYRELLRNQMN